MSKPFSFEEVTAVLEQTPHTLESLLGNLPDALIQANEGENTWSAFDILGHLIHGEKTDWIPRLDIILNKEDKLFEPFDRFAQERESVGKTFDQLLQEFKDWRSKNLETLKAFQLSEKDFAKEGQHPELGSVTVENLLSAWAAHDLGHIYQVSRVVAKQFKDSTGPWPKYLRVVTD